VAEADRRLTRVHAGAEQFELEDRVQLAQLRLGPRLHAQPALPHAGVEAAVMPELVLERGELRRAHDVEPVGIVLVEVVPHVEHGEPVQIDLGLP
jgi:hypothetical protein